MITTRLYLDCRKSDGGQPAPLKYVITKKGLRSLINLNINIFPVFWDAENQRVTGTLKADGLNVAIKERKDLIEDILKRLAYSGALEGMTSPEIKKRVMEVMDGVSRPQKPVLFSERFELFMNRKSEGTRRLYGYTLARLRQYAGASLDTLMFEDMTVDWLRGFDAWLARTSPGVNARNIHFRNMRAVFNDAIDEEVTQAYPFRRFKLKPQRTRKRALKVEVLRELFDMPLPKHLERYRDLFKLTFFLCGINTVDLCNLKEITDGRIEYERAKTHRLYSIKVEPEAMAIIERNKGQRWLLSPLDTNRHYRSYYSRFAKGLRDIRDLYNQRHPEAPLTDLSTYWARHSWATTAAWLEVPKETIAAGLGHGGNTVTDIYIDFDMKKVDIANRRVLDWVLYGKE